MDVRGGLVGALAVGIPVGAVSVFVLEMVSPDGSLLWLAWVLAAAAAAGGFVYEGSDDT